MAQNVDIPEYEIETQFMDFMRENNCEPDGKFRLEIDGQLHRYKVRGDKGSEKSGAYCIFNDEWPAGWCQNWRIGESVIWSFERELSTNKEYHAISEAEYQARLERSRQRQAELKKQREQEQARASEHARILVEGLPEAPKVSDHAYMIKKGIYSYGVKYHKDIDSILVPLRDIDGRIRSYQSISADGSKKFCTDAPTKGNFWSIALDDSYPDDDKERRSPILLGEGFATMSTVYELTSLPCVAAMTAGNLKPVAEALKTKYPNKPIIIMADNDHLKDFNTGKEKAEQACKELDLAGVVMPDFSESEDGTDWNDYCRLHNEDETRDAIRRKLGELPLYNERLKYIAQAKELGILTGEYITTFSKPAPGGNFLIQNWIPSEALMMLFAPSGSGKGFLAVDIAYAIASPEIDNWHGMKIHKHGPVVYLIGEGQRGARKRCAGYIYYKDIDPAKTEMAFITEPLLLNDPSPEAGVKRMIANIGMMYPHPVLIIIDTTNRYMFGDENKSTDATSFISAVDQIRKHFKCSAMIVHHTGLNPETQGRARGSSVFKAAVDMEFRVTKLAMNLTFEMTKSKDTEIQKPLAFEMLQVEAPGFYTDDGDKDTTCVLRLDEAITEAKAHEEKPAVKMTKSEKFARETYQEAAIEYGEIIAATNSAQYVVAVDVEKWREVFYRMTSASKDSARPLFNKARKLLTEDTKLLFKQIDGDVELFCLTRQDESYDAEIRAGILNRQRRELNN